MKKDQAQTTSSATGMPSVPFEPDVKEKIMSLTPLAVQVIYRILDDPNSPLNAQNQVIDIILNRTYGKPEGFLMMKSGERTIEESGIHLQAIVERIRNKEGKRHE